MKTKYKILIEVELDDSVGYTDEAVCNNIYEGIERQFDHETPDYSIMKVDIIEKK